MLHFSKIDIWSLTLSDYCCKSTFPLGYTKAWKNIWSFISSFSYVYTNGIMNILPLALMRKMMDQRINSAVYVKVLKWTHEFPTERWPWEPARGKEKIFWLQRQYTEDCKSPFEAGFTDVIESVSVQVFLHAFVHIFTNCNTSVRHWLLRLPSLNFLSSLTSSMVISKLLWLLTLEKS